MSTNGNGGAKPKLKVAKYWASSCGGCDISLLEIHEHLLELSPIDANHRVFDTQTLLEVDRAGPLIDRGQSDRFGHDVVDASRLPIAACSAQKTPQT